MILEADFQRQLKDPRARRIVLVEQDFAYEAAGAPAIGTYYFANRAYRTGPLDVPANRAYRDVVDEMPGYGSTIDSATLGGNAQLNTPGVVRLFNGDGSLDFLEDTIIDGRETRFYVGFDGYERADFRLVQVAVAERVQSTGEMALQITLKDKRLLLDAGVAGPVVTGTGADAGKFQTLGFGTVRNIPVLVKDEATLTYQVIGNPKSTSALLDLRDGGLSLSSGNLFSANNAALTANVATDTMTRAAHGLLVDDVIVFTKAVPTGSDIFSGLGLSVQYWVIAAGLTANDWRVSLTKGGAAVDIIGTVFAGTVTVVRRRYYDLVAVDGTVLLSSPVIRRLTADVEDSSTTDVGAAVRALVVGYGNLPAGSIDEAEFTNLTTALQAKTGISPPGTVGLAVLDRANLIDLLDWLARSFSFAYGFDHAGVFRLVVIDPMTIGAAATDYEVSAIDGELEVENLAPTAASVALGVERNWEVQADGLLDGVSATARAQYSKQFQSQGNSTAPTGTAYATNWQLFHKTAVTGALEDTVLTKTSGFIISHYTEIADAHLADKRPHLRLARIRIGLEAYSWRLGQVVNLTRPRHGFAAGRKTRILGKRVDWLAGVVDLTLIARVAPDISTSDRP